MPHPPTRAEFTASYLVESSVAAEKAAQVITQPTDETTMFRITRRQALTGSAALIV